MEGTGGKGERRGWLEVYPVVIWQVMKGGTLLIYPHREKMSCRYRWHQDLFFLLSSFFSSPLSIHPSLWGHSENYLMFVFMSVLSIHIFTVSIHLSICKYCNEKPATPLSKYQGINYNRLILNKHFIVYIIFTATFGWFACKKSSGNIIKCPWFHLFVFMCRSVHVHWLYEWGYVTTCKVNRVSYSQQSN